MRILIIGSEGYIGSRLSPFLIKNGYEVSRLDQNYYGGNHKIIFGDYNSFSSHFFDDYQTIILLAGHSSVSLCEKDKQGSFINNVLKFKYLLHKLNKGQRLLYASSASVINGVLNASETVPVTSAICDYDMHKQVIEKIASVSDVETIGMRFGTVGGYSTNPRLELIINSMYHDSVNIGCIGVSNGNNYRAFLGLNDLCNSIKKLIQIKSPQKIYNIASGNLTINRIAEKIASINDSVRIKYNEGGSTYSFSVDASLIQKEVKLTDTIESICDEMGDMVTKDKTLYNRVNV